jgi:hypothetical protein
LLNKIWWVLRVVTRNGDDTILFCFFYGAKCFDLAPPFQVVHTNYKKHTHTHPPFGCELFIPLWRKRRHHRNIHTLYGNCPHPHFVPWKITSLSLDLDLEYTHINTHTHTTIHTLSVSFFLSISLLTLSMKYLSLSLCITFFSLHKGLYSCP